MKLVLALIGAATLGVTAVPVAAAPKAEAAKACFRTSDIGAHTVGDDHTLYLNVGPKDVYRVTMRNTCLGGVTSADPIELSARGSGSICEAGDLDIHTTLAGGGGLPARCVVDDLVKLTPAEAAATRKTAKP
jgi:uncharacterized protein DUF6491